MSEPASFFSQCPASAAGTQSGSLVAGFAPTIVTALGEVADGGWLVIGMVTVVVAIIAVIATSAAKETDDGNN